MMTETLYYTLEKKKILANHYFTASLFTILSSEADNIQTTFEGGNQLIGQVCLQHLLTLHIINPDLPGFGAKDCFITGSNKT